MPVTCRYEELEAISVSEKLSKLDTNDTKVESANDDEDKTDVTSADGKAVADGKNENKLLGIRQFCTDKC